MRPDPVRGIRQLYTRELQALLRHARDDATLHIRNHFQYRSQIDVEAIREILEKILSRRFLPDAEDLIKRFTRTSYLRGIDQVTTALDLSARTAGPPTPVAIAIGFDQADLRAIDNLSSVQLVDLNGVTTDLVKRLVHDLVQADRQGAGVTKITKLISSDFQTLGIARVERITRTALNQAYNEAAWSRIRRSAPHKEWIPTNDDRTRPGHKIMKGVVIDTEDLFLVPAFYPTPNSKKKVPEAHMYYPGDVSQKPDLAQIINCRCTVAPRFRKTS